jgi:hypothetical protein
LKEIVLGGGGVALVIGSQEIDRLIGRGVGSLFTVSDGNPEDRGEKKERRNEKRRRKGKGEKGERGERGDLPIQMSRGGVAVLVPNEVWEGNGVIFPEIRRVIWIRDEISERVRDGEGEQISSKDRRRRDGSHHLANHKNVRWGRVVRGADDCDPVIGPILLLRRGHRE